MNADEQQPANTNTEPASSPQAPQQSGSKTVAILIGIIVFLLAVLIGFGAFALTNKNDDKKSSGESSQAPDEDDSAAKSSKPSDKPLQTGIKTDEPDFEVQLDSIKASSNSVTINFSVVCKTGDTLCFLHNLWDTKGDVLAGAYIIDDAAQQKYEVIKDANGEVIASDIEDVALKNKEKLSYFVNITKPPKDAEVTIYLPNVQPISDITITK